MKRLVLIIFCLMPFADTGAQNLDSLFSRVLSIEHPGINAAESSGYSGPVKCGFGVMCDAKIYFDKFSLLQKQTLSSILQRPVTDTSVITPSKKFMIHFNKSGTNAPLYDVNMFSKAADSAYNFEVNILGFPAPPLNAGALYYDIYIQSLGGGNYGYTEPDKRISDSTYTSFTVIDNSFGTGFFTHGINAAKVTIAHEFHHAIQIGNYIYRYLDTYYYELTSTSMEEFVFSDVNDYYNYIQYYLQSPDRTFSSNDGYDLAIWNIFMKERFGFGPIKRSWELMPKERALQCISDAISEAGSSYKIEFSTFGQWTFFTGNRAVAGKYFKEAANYPLIKPININGTISVNSEAASNNFFMLKSTFNGVADSAVALISNSDIKGGITSPVSILPFNYTLSTTAINGGKQISDRFYSKLDVPNGSFLLAESNVLTGAVTTVSIDYPYPQPFRYSRNQQINLPFPNDGTHSAELYIYSIDMRLVYSGQKLIVDTEKIIWDAMDSAGRKLSTGIYIYVIKSDNQLKNGKLVIYND